MLGALGLAASARELQRLGWPAIAAHDAAPRAPPACRPGRHPGRSPPRPAGRHKDPSDRDIRRGRHAARARRRTAQCRVRHRRQARLLLRAPLPRPPARARRGRSCAHSGPPPAPTTDTRSLAPSARPPGIATSPADIDRFLAAVSIITGGPPAGPLPIRPNLRRLLARGIRPARRDGQRGHTLQNRMTRARTPMTMGSTFVTPDAEHARTQLRAPRIRQWSPYRTDEQQARRGTSQPASR